MFQASHINNVVIVGHSKNQFLKSNSNYTQTQNKVDSLSSVQKQGVNRNFWDLSVTLKSSLYMINCRHHNWNLIRLFPFILQPCVQVNQKYVNCEDYCLDLLPIIIPKVRLALSTFKEMRIQNKKTTTLKLLNQKATDQYLHGS